ncbi:MAG TPA: GNAT family N-acetyltransferase [Pyrinomonadaceae bacterium]|nr:GNAT family N-acetyltransferase [Pyrinomonadaceae bacterium]
MLLQRTQKTYAPIATAIPLPLSVAPDLSRICRLTNDDEAEVMSFLSLRPVHTVVMKSFITDNGIESELNRGAFYGYRNASGNLEGVALIGHSTLVEARTDNAMHALAITARNSETRINLIMSDGDAAESFWGYFSGGTCEPRLRCVEELFELNFPFLVKKCKWEVRYAKPDELEQIAEAQAEVALLESGVDPMARDREGFLRRVARRIEQNRIFVVVQDGKLVFKADVVALTDDVAYLEGVHVHPEHRGDGVGSSCLAEVGLRLLNQVQNVCLLSNVEFKHAHGSFLKAGFRNTDRCTTLFL